MHTDWFQGCPQELAEEERQFHTVTDIVTKHRESATNKSPGTVEDPGFLGGRILGLYLGD